MTPDDRPSPRGQVLLVDDSVIYQWPVGPNRLVLRWREGDELTARIEPLDASASDGRGSDTPKSPGLR